MTPKRLISSLTFRIERWLQRGWLHQLAIAALLVVGISITAGCAVWIATDAFSGPGEAIWWAFLRLSDPGYLGDDEGLLLRVISTAVTVAGYVLFLGSLVAIMTQWLTNKMTTLERGLTPIVMRGHVVILGWTGSTLDVVRELVVARGRMHRFLKRRGLRNFQLVILAEEVTAHRRLELAEHIGTEWDVNDIILRSGTPLTADHLARVDALNAATVILPGADRQSTDTAHADTRTVKTLMTLARMTARSDSPSPMIVTELVRPDTIPVAQAISGTNLEVVESGRTIARLVAQTTRHPGLSAVYSELLSREYGNEIYLQTHAAVDGLSFQEAAAWFPQATLLGAVRGTFPSKHAHLNPPPEFTFEPGDRLVLIATAHEFTTPTAPSSHEASPLPSLSPSAPTTPSDRTGETQRILCLGWSQRAEPLFHEYRSYTREQFDITIVSTVSARQRNAHLASLPETDRLRITHVEADYTREAMLESVHPTTFDTILFLGSDRFQSSEETDARTLLGYMLLQKHLAESSSTPDLIIELVDASNAHLLEGRTGEVIVTPAIMSRMLAHVALQRELGIVFGELFGPSGAEIYFHAPHRYGIERGATHSTRALQHTVTECGATLIGIRDHRSGTSTVHLNPANDTSWTLTPNTELIVIMTYSQL